MMNCQYLTAYKAGEILDGEPGRITNWAEWLEYECTHSGALDGRGCPFLDSFDAKCPIKDGQIADLEDWAIRQLAGDREDAFTRIRELMREVGE